ncbi:MAG TPA: hypothetical protein VLD37_00690, partial [Candidatus Bilamarchaeum sp.]|nr:hypothetical protein [Candidatus Bilamarchaeum sp.]
MAEKLAKRSAEQAQAAQQQAQAALRHAEQRVGPAISPEAASRSQSAQAMAQVRNLLEGGSRVRSFLSESGMQTPNMQAGDMQREMAVLAERTRSPPSGASEAQRNRLEAVNEAAKSAVAAFCSNPPDLRTAAYLYRQANALAQLNNQIGAASGSPRAREAAGLYSAAFDAINGGDPSRASSLVGAADLYLRAREPRERRRALELGRTIQGTEDESRRGIAERELTVRLDAHHLEKSGSAHEDARKALRLAAGFFERGLQNEGALSHQIADGFRNAAQVGKLGRERISGAISALRSRVEELDRCERESKTLMQLRGAEGQDAHSFWSAEFASASVHLAVVEVAAYEQRLSNALNALGLSMQTAIAMFAMDIMKTLNGKLKEQFTEEEVKMLRRAAEEIISCLSEEGKLQKLGKKKAAELFHTAAEKFAKVKEAGKGKIAAAMAEAEKALIAAMRLGKAETALHETNAARKKYLSQLTRMEAALTAIAKKLGAVTDSKGKKIFDELEFRRAIRAVRLAIEKAKTKGEMDRLMGGLAGLQKAVDLASKRAKRVILLENMAKEAGQMLRMAENFRGAFNSLMRSHSGLMDKETLMALRRAFMGLSTLASGKKEDEHARTNLVGLQGLQKTLLGLLQKARDGTIAESEMDSWASRFRGAKLNFRAQMNGISLQFSALKEALASKFFGKQAEKQPMLKMGMDESARAFLRAAELAHDHAILRGEKGREFSADEMKKMTIVGKFGGLLLFVHDGKLYAVRESKAKVGKGKRGRTETRYMTEYTFHEDLAMFQKRKDKDLLELAKEVITHGEDLHAEARRSVKEGFVARGRYMPHRAFALIAEEQAAEWERSLKGRGSEKFAGQLDRLMAMMVRANIVFSGERRDQFFNMVARSFDIILGDRKLVRDSRRADEIDVELGRLGRERKSRFDSAAKHQAKAEKSRGAKKAALERTAEKLFREEEALAKRAGALEAEKKELVRGLYGKQVPDPAGVALILDNLVRDGEQRIARDEQAEKVLQAMKGIALLATSFVHGGAGLAAWGADLAYTAYKTGDVHAKEILPFALSLATHGASSYVAAMMRARGLGAGEAGAEALIRSPWQVKAAQGLALSNARLGLAIGMEGALDAMGQLRPGADAADWVMALTSMVQGFGLPAAHSVHAFRRMRMEALLQDRELSRRYINTLTMEQLYSREGAKASFEGAKALGFEGSRAEFNDSMRARSNSEIVRKYSAMPDSKLPGAAPQAKAEGYVGSAEQFRSDVARQKALERSLGAQDPAANAAANEAAARASLAKAKAALPEEAPKAPSRAAEKEALARERGAPAAPGGGTAPATPKAMREAAPQKPGTTPAVPKAIKGAQKPAWSALGKADSEIVGNHSMAAEAANLRARNPRLAKIYEDAVRDFLARARVNSPEAVADPKLRASVLDMAQAEARQKVFEAEPRHERQKRAFLSATGEEQVSDSLSSGWKTPSEKTLNAYAWLREQPADVQARVRERIAGKLGAEDRAAFLRAFGENMAVRGAYAPDYRPVNQIDPALARDPFGKVVVSPDEKALKDGVLARAAGENLHAQGVERGKGGLNNLINIMLEGSVRHGEFGPMAEMRNGRPFADPSYHSGAHGPFFIVVEGRLQGAVGDPTVRGPVGEHRHAAYVVPSAKHRQAISLALVDGVRKGLITREEAVSLLAKVVTYQEFISAKPRAFSNALQAERAGRETAEKALSESGIELATTNRAPVRPPTSAIPVSEGQVVSERNVTPAPKAGEGARGATSPLKRGAGKPFAAREVAKMDKMHAMRERLAQRWQQFVEKRWQSAMERTAGELGLPLANPIVSELSMLRKTSRKLAKTYEEKVREALGKLAPGEINHPQNGPLFIRAAQRYARDAVYRQMGVSLEPIERGQMRHAGMETLLDSRQLFTMFVGGNLGSEAARMAGIKRPERFSVKMMPGAVGAFRVTVGKGAKEASVFLKEMSLGPDAFATKLFAGTGVLTPEVRQVFYKTPWGAKAEYGLMQDVRGIPGVRRACAIADLAGNPELAGKVWGNMGEFSEALGHAMERSRARGLQDRHARNVWVVETNDGKIKIAMIDLDIVASYP